MIGAVNDAIFKLVKKERRLIESYRHGYVSLQKIIWKAKPYEALDATINKNFILKHEKFVDAEYVLKVRLHQDLTFHFFQQEQGN